MAESPRFYRFEAPDKFVPIDQVPDNILEFYSPFSSLDTAVLPNGTFWPAPYAVELHVADKEKSPSHCPNIIEWIGRYPFYGALSNYFDDFLEVFFDAPSLPAFIRYISEPLMMFSLSNVLSQFAFKIVDPYERSKVLRSLSPDSMPLAELLVALFSQDS